MYFELNEFLASDTAKKKNIDNIPTFEAVDHLEELVTSILDPLRKEWGSPLRVCSGYRSKALNKAVGGVKTSSHLTGYAADIAPTDARRVGSFILFANAWLYDKGIAFDQAIDEAVGGTRWWHISIRHNDGRQRGEFLTIHK